MIAYFKSQAGKVIARHYNKRAAPKAIFDGDAWYDRDDTAEPPKSVGSALPGIIIKDRPFVSIAAPLKGSRWDNPNNPAPSYTPDGMAAFNSGNEAREWAKRGATEDGEYALDP